MKKKIIAILIAVMVLAMAGCSDVNTSAIKDFVEGYGGEYLDLSTVPEYTGEKGYVVLNDNFPQFTEEEMQKDVFEQYSELDIYGRCGQAYAMLGPELMPRGERENISHIRPTGWQSVEYKDLIEEDGHLYNRSHLIAYSLAGENDNDKNLITGTQYMNQKVMQIFELDVLDYIRQTYNKVLYRVTPIFEGDELVARGVQMEAYSVEDDGEGICFNVYVYNVQPGIEIDYETGDNWRASSTYDGNKNDAENTYILNTSSKKFHTEDCSGADDMNPANREEFEGTRKELIDDGYKPCGSCRP